VLDGVGDDAELAEAVVQVLTGRGHG
jgi:hypothetical protein